MRQTPSACFAVLLALTASALTAQTVTVDCSVPSNAGNPECLALPPAQDATNFVPLIAPTIGGLAAVAGLAAAAAGGAEQGGNTTTSTTSTVPN